MTAPNLKNPTTITGKTARIILPTTSITTVTGVVNLTNSGKVLKINSIFAANVNGTSPADISISIYNGSVDNYIVSTVSVPADATQIISTKETYFYLEEGDSLRATAGLANAISIIVGYEEIV